MPPKKTAVKRNESVKSVKKGSGSATTTEDIMDAVEAMTGETSRLQKAPISLQPKISNNNADKSTEEEEEAEVAITKIRVKTNKSATISAAAPDVGVGGTSKKKSTATVSRSASVRVTSKAAEKDKEKLSKTTEVNGTTTKGLKRSISVRGRKKKGAEEIDEVDGDSSAVSKKAMGGRKKKNNNKTVQEELNDIQEEDEAMDVTEEPTAGGGNGTALLSDTNNNSKRGATKRKIHETAEGESVSSGTSLRRGASFKQQKISIQPIHDRGAGAVYAFGKGDMGQLGLGEDVLKRNYPCLVDALKDLKVIQVVAGGIHTVVLDEAGSVWTFGCNDDKALGRVTEDEEDNFVPGKVELAKRIVQISAGDSHTAVLTEEGDVYAWGTFKDSNGNIGLVPGEGEMCRVEAQLMSALLPTKVKKISSGDHHLVMLTVDGKIFTCGNGELGQLGRNYDYTEKRATRSSTNPSNLSPKDSMLRPQEVRCGASKFADIWTGSFATYASTVTRKPTSDIWVCGLNSRGQLGMKPEGSDCTVKLPVKSSGFSKKKWKQIAGGHFHAVALDEDGHVYSLGRGDDGRLGLGDDADDKYQPTEVPSLKDKKCVHVSAGLSTAYAINADGTVYSWGCGVNFQLGNGSSDEASEPIEIEHMVEEKKKLDISGKVKYISGGGQHVVLTLAKDS